MTFNDDARIGRGRVSKRGRNTGIAVGGGGLGLVAIVLIGQLLGVDLSGLAGGLGGGAGTAPQGEEESLAQCQTGADANEDINCRMVGAADTLDDYWSGQVRDYVQPELVIFEGGTTTGCGNATSAVGPFYCPADQKIYLDTAFYNDLQTRFGASGGELAELYVVAHEWGHHIQNTTGIMSGLNLQESGPDSDGVRLELQADCFAGAWAGDATETEDAQGRPLLEPITEEQLAQALSAAAAVGDDRIQERTQGQVLPETWTHGASESRQKWFTVGYQEGPQACDTFQVSANQL
jgi:predicted metalloprotease